MAHLLHHWPIMAVFPLCLAVHEWAHAAMADASGDPTPRRDGRVSLDPLRHLDPIGSVALPLAAFVISGGSVLLGWAKPVRFRPAAFRKPRIGIALTAAAGPVANLVTGAAAAVLYRLVPGPPIVSQAIFAFAAISLMLFALNLLIPIPPLDGSFVLASLLPTRTAKWYLEHGAWGLAGVAAACVGGLFMGLDVLGSFLGATGLRLLGLLTGA